MIQYLTENSGRWEERHIYDVPRGAAISQKGTRTNAQRALHSSLGRCGHYAAAAAAAVLLTFDFRSSRNCRAVMKHLRRRDRRFLALCKLQVEFRPLETNAASDWFQILINESKNNTLSLSPPPVSCNLRCPSWITYGSNFEYVMWLWQVLTSVT